MTDLSTYEALQARLMGLTGAALALAGKFSVRHTRKEGARYHVLSFSGCKSARTYQIFGVTWCSEPFCEINLAAIMGCVEHGLDPSRASPSPDAKDWLRSREGAAALEALIQRTRNDGGRNG